MALDALLASTTASIKKELDELIKFEMDFKGLDKSVDEILKDPAAFKKFSQDKAALDAHIKILNNAMPQVKKLDETFAAIESVVNYNTKTFHLRLLKLGALELELKKMRADMAANVQTAVQLSAAYSTMFNAARQALTLFELEAAEMAAKRKDMTPLCDELAVKWQNLAKEIDDFQKHVVSFEKLMKNNVPK